MACFITPLVLGVIVEALRRLASGVGRKLRMDIWSTMLLGGSLVLAVEHVWHGEVVPWPPFLTAMENPADIPVMFHEMLYVGGSMSAAVTAAWLGILAYTRSKLTAQRTPVKQLTGAVDLRGAG
ncbi:hypothetical protein [Desulfurococcus mucosus]|uniref:Uncharacterized protein n=1 Tax=Desulfurococcus mucosus (strain ATCC 35584 / DSM 2162 / JCM 9187 / O7/1) TaxID=765177 RepID=E8R8P3_DESM0|nr:hypothetical protein [Desulfurococcus mucosus]ADV64869.1 hypothetical protein Desmu_0560 [Desulfurococcus mucosus DSM 2162]